MRVDRSYIHLTSVLPCLGHWENTYNGEDCEENSHEKKKGIHVNLRFIQSQGS